MKRKIIGILILVIIVLLIICNLNKVEDNEEFIVRRLYREKRVGTVEKLDEYTYRFSADIYDSSEIIPWIRTFICRIVQMNFSNRTQENKFKEDLDEMYRMYGIGEEVSE